MLNEIAAWLRRDTDWTPSDALSDLRKVPEGMRDGVVMRRRVGGVWEFRRADPETITEYSYARAIR